MLKYALLACLFGVGLSHEEYNWDKELEKPTLCPAVEGVKWFYCYNVKGYPTRYCKYYKKGQPCHKKWGRCECPCTYNGNEVDYRCSPRHTCRYYTKCICKEEIPPVTCESNCDFYEDPTLPCVLSPIPEVTCDASQCYPDLFFGGSSTFQTPFLKEGVFETSDQGYYFEMGALYNPNTIGDNGLKGSGKLSFHVCEDQIADPPVTTNGEIDVFCFEPGNDVPILEFSVSINTGADRFEAETNYDESILVPGVFCHGCAQHTQDAGTMCLELNTCVHSNARMQGGCAVPEEDSGEEAAQQTFPNVLNMPCKHGPRSNLGFYHGHHYGQCSCYNNFLGSTDEAPVYVPNDLNGIAGAVFNLVGQTAGSVYCFWFELNPDPTLKDVEVRVYALGTFGVHIQINVNCRKKGTRESTVNEHFERHVQNTDTAFIVATLKPSDGECFIEFQPDYTLQISNKADYDRAYLQLKHLV